MYRRLCSSFCWLSFYLLMVSFAVQNLFILMQSHYFHYPRLRRSISKNIAMSHVWDFTAYIFFKDFLFILFLDSGEEKEGEKHQCVVASCALPTGGTWPATQACALTGNQTSNPLVRRLVLNPLSHTSQGLPIFSSRIFMVFTLTFKSFIHFEFIFVCDVRRWCSFIFLHISVQFSKYHLLNRLSLAHFMCSLTLLNIN